MTEAKRKKLVYVAFVIAAIWGVYNFAGDNKSKDTKYEPERIQPTVTATCSTAAVKPVEIEKLASTPWGADPFHPKAKDKPARTVAANTDHVWMLSGIVYNKTSPMAVINGRTVRTGDTIDNAKIINIERKSVLLKYKGTKLRLTVTKG